ncbi:helix-turn-helix domain-containing protein [Nocardiopsis sp. HUAS JQ3]|uniref:helix-turn-helix domain-containing protein n=1 Tax=Nocardiopsis sp. HUAS JQ3 TaxID=3061629 RepID=UPI0023A97010|nr:helix-turn-helix domain-containing protein [Nocardiopsis sp. HUAS JQ3]WDZ92863.1 helix-turn-helix domain-containing protein [Nocardiopsis sp. HUAS JQ3]
MSGGTVPPNRHGKAVPEQDKRGYSAGSGGRRDNTADTLPEVFTPEEAAALLKVPESWLRKRASARQVPCTFIGKHLRFSSNDLEQIIRSGHRAPVSGSTRPRQRPIE